MKANTVIFLFVLLFLVFLFWNSIVSGMRDVRDVWRPCECECAGSSNE